MFQIVGAVRLVNRLPRLLQRGQKQRNQNRNDGDDNEVSPLRIFSDAEHFMFFFSFSIDDSARFSFVIN